MRPSRPGRPALAFLAVLLAACAGPAVTSPVPSATPGGPAGPSLPPPTPIASAGQTPPGGPPPPASLVTAGTAHEGRLGSWTWAGGGDAAPWLPAPALGRAVAVPVGSDVSVAVEGDPPIASWIARFAPAGDRDGASAAQLAQGTGAPRFTVPTAGDWVVAVQLVFEGRRGDATWSWRIVVR